MPVLHSWNCPQCDSLVRDRWTDDVPECCGAPMRIAFLPAAHKNTEEWGSPRHIPTLRDEPFGSRSELKQFCKDNHLALGASSEKVGGARNEGHMNLGRIYSFGR